MKSGTFDLDSLSCAIEKETGKRLTLDQIKGIVNRSMVGGAGRMELRLPQKQFSKAGQSAISALGSTGAASLANDDKGNNDMNNPCPTLAEESSSVETSPMYSNPDEDGDLQHDSIPYAQVEEVPGEDFQKGTLTLADLMKRPAPELDNLSVTNVVALEGTPSKGRQRKAVVAFCLSY